MCAKKVAASYVCSMQAIQTGLSREKMLNSKSVFARRKRKLPPSYLSLISIVHCFSYISFSRR